MDNHRLVPDYGCYQGEKYGKTAKGSFIVSTNRGKLYTILFAACIAGYMLLFYQMTLIQSETNTVEVCLFKHATNLPCASCGSTRSVLSLLSGNFLDSLYINPLGILIALIMLIVPLWIMLDLATKRNTLFVIYNRAVACLKHPRLAIPLILLVLVNWIWNISKGL